MFRNISVVLLLVVTMTMTAVRVAPLFLSPDQQRAFERTIVEVVRRTTGYSPARGPYARMEVTDGKLTRRGTRGGTEMEQQVVVDVTRPSFLPGGPPISVGKPSAVPRSGGAKFVRVGQ